MNKLVFNKITNSYYFVALCLFCASFFIILLFSISTSPLYKEILGTDSSVYQIIAKYWNYDRKPYSDFIDHKGILIYLIDKAGYLLTGDKKGIFLIQVINLLIVSLGYFMISKLYVKNNRSALFLSLIGLGFYEFGFTSFAGNSVEEWFMPFAVFSIYFQSKYFNNVNIKKHPPIFALFYGVSFAIAIFTILRNAVMLCCMVACIVVILMLNKEWYNLIINAMFFIGGVFLVLLPSLLFLVTEGIVEEAWTYGFLFNFKYAGINFGIPLDRQYTIKTFFLFFTNWYGPIAALLAGMIAIAKKESLKGVSYAVCSCIYLLLLLRANALGSYAIPAAPFLIVLLGELYVFINQSGLRRGLFCFIAFCSIVVGVYPLYSINARKNQGILYDWNKCPVIENVDENDRDDMVLVGCEPGIYLKYNINPASKWFVMQNIFVSADKNIADLIVDDYEKKAVKWIIIQGNPEQSFLYDFLRNKYVLISEEQDQYLFRRK